MSKLIDADKLKESFNRILERFNTENPHKEVIMSVINTEPAVLLSCPKCHGTGEYIVPMFDYGEFPTRYEKRPCEICHKTGKLTVEDYEMLQEACREK